jgi:hypothetical protein
MGGAINDGCRRLWRSKAMKKNAKLVLSKETLRALTQEQLPGVRDKVPCELKRTPPQSPRRPTTLPRLSEKVPGDLKESFPSTGLPGFSAASRLPLSPVVR